MSGYTIVQALAALPALRREHLERLELTGGREPTLTCHPHPTAGAPFGGPITSDIPAPEQLHELSAAGLFGTCRIDRGGDITRIELWSTEEEHTHWQRRVDMSLSDPYAAQMLATAGDLKVGQWHRDSAMARLRSAVWSAAAAHALNPSEMIRLGQVARGTVYDALKAMPPGYQAPEPPPIAQPTPDEQDPAADAPAPPATAAAPSPVALERMPMGHTAPCVICGTEAMKTLAGVPLHAGECLRLYLELEPGARPTSPPTRPNTAEPKPATDTPVQAPKAPTPQPARGTKPTRSPGRRTTPGSQSASVQPGKRFRALAAALDEDFLYLPGGERHEWQATHLGDLARLTVTHRLGAGGGKLLPDRGEIWLYPGALARLGLPEAIELDSMLDQAARAEQRATTFQALNATPAVADALANGWVLDPDGRMDARTRIRHPDHPTWGAHLVAIPWAYTDVPLLVDDDQVVPPPELVDRLQEWVDRITVPYHVTSGVTGLHLIDRTRPPRRDPDGTPPGGAASVVRDVAAELPPFYANRRDRRFTMVEANYSWWRRWGSLSDDEQLPYVHAYDHRSHFLNPWGGVLLGIDGLDYRARDDARWAGDERAGYYLVSRWDHDWPDWRLPDPFCATPAIADTDHVWVTAHTLKQLDKLAPGLTDSLTYVEAYTWTNQAQYLAGAAKLLRDARNTATAPVADTVKDLYSVTTQKLASTDARPNYHLYRPDWRDMIHGASRTAVASAVMTAHTAPRPEVLLVADRDTLIYASPDPDPRTAWPGDPNKLDDLRGGWRPIGSGHLPTWGPDALADRSGRWRYARHMPALSGVSG